jgi:hypothetical protein
MAVCPQCRFRYEPVDTALSKQVTTTVVEFKAAPFFARFCRR